MASKVNTKFVAGLSVGLIGVFALTAGAAFYLLKNNAKDLIRKGDAAYAEAQKIASGGDAAAASIAFKKAAELYSKGVNKEQTNIEFVHKWQDALTHYAPDTRVSFDEAFLKYHNSLRHVAAMLRTDADAHRRFLDLILETARATGSNRRSMDSLLAASKESLAFFNDASPELKPKAEGLRRYRGIAVVRLLELSADVKQEDADALPADLETALRADPKDDLAAEYLALYYEGRAAKARRESRPEDAQLADAKEAEIVDAFLKANPNNPRLTLRQIAIEIVAAQRKAPPINTVQEAITQSEKVAAPLRPRLDQLAALLQSVDQKTLDTDVLGRFELMDGLLDQKGQRARTEAVLRKAIEARPTDVELLMMLASVFESRNDFPRAIETAQKTHGLPRLPVGVAGLRLFGAEQQADYNSSIWSFRRWTSVTDGAEKAKALDEARLYRDRLGKLVSADTPEMNLLNGQIAFAEGNVPAADRFIKTYNDQTKQTTVDGLALAAEIHLRQNAVGLARDELERLISFQPGNVAAMLTLARIYTQIQDAERAEKVLAYAADVDPSNADVQSQLKMVRAMANKGEAGDPVVDALFKARRLAEERGPEGQTEVIAMLDKIVKDSNYDTRAVQVMAGTLLTYGKREQTLDLVKRAVQAKPDELVFKQLEAGLAETDPLKAALKIIELQDAPPVDKAMARYEAYTQHGKTDEAKAELEKAAKDAPDHESVVRRQFSQALLANDVSTAERLLEIARRKNLDQADGELFRARLLAIKGNSSEAIRVVEDYTSHAAGNVEAWRLLGALRVQANRRNDAVLAYQKAVEARPSDIPAIKDLINTLASTQPELALGRAREYQKIARNDPAFAHMWLSLEATYGDKLVALEARRRYLPIDSTDRPNLVAVAALQIEVGKLDDARRSIDTLTKAGEALDSVGLEARWQEASGDVAKAKAAYESYIAKQDPEKGPIEPFLAYAQFLYNRGDQNTAIAQLEKVRDRQDPKTVPVDRALVQTYLRAGNDAQALEVARRVVAAGADTPNHLFQRMVVEALLRVRKFDEADKELATLIPFEKTDPSVMLLRADAKRARGDRKATLAVLDEAVARFPDRAEVFAARSMVLMVTEGRLRDARADIDKAIELDPNQPGTLALRAGLKQEDGDAAGWLTDIRAAIKAAPANTDLWRGAVESLLLKGEDATAVEVADDVISANRDTAGINVQVGDLLTRFTQWERAARYYQKAFEKEASPGNTSLYINALLNQNPPKSTEVVQVLGKVQDKIAGDPALLMARARLNGARKQVADAKKDATDALRILVERKSGGLFVQWYSSLSRIIADSKDMIAYLDATEKAGLAPKWMRFFRANVLFNDAATRAKGVQDMHELTASENDRELRVAAFRALTIGHYVSKKFDDAVKYGREAVEAFPNDPGFNNDLAFTLASELDRPEEALPFAEKAVAAMKEQPEILDTIGVVLRKLNRLDEARRHLERAKDMSATPASLVTILSHLADLCLAQGDRPAAQKYLDLTKQEMLKNQALVPADVKDKVAELESKMKN